MTARNKISEFIDNWGTPTELAVDLGISTQHLRMMRLRGSIPVRFWPRLVAASYRRSMDGISYEVLVALHIDSAALTGAKP
jgi:hypothetical protein